VRVSVVGLGYVGLVTSACLADQGHDVVGIEVSPERIQALVAGRVPFFEPGLTDLVVAGVKSGRLTFSEKASAVRNADVVFIAVGTHDGFGGWHTNSIQACLNNVVPEMADDAALVVRSTLPPWFLAQLPNIVRRIREEAGRPELAVLLNPEFTKEGTAVRDFQEPDRVVLGIASDPTGRGEKLLRRLYRHVNTPVLAMPATDASLSKLGANLFLATKISFANELAELCDTYGADIQQVVAAMSYDKRIGGGFMRAGIGFGGSCLPHQVTMTVRTADETGAPAPLFAAVAQVNQRQRERMVERLGGLLGGSVEGARIALLGVTFKPDTDDLREAPSLDIAARLIDLGATVVAYDPMAEAVARFAGLVPGVVVADTVDEALTGADAAALATEWLEFRQLDWRRAAGLMRRPIIVDGRNALSPLELVDAGFAYASFGRGTWGTTEAVVETPLEQSAVPAPAERPETLRHGARETEERVRGFGLARGPAGVD
jgi:UDPglucose 6-dehydrogenase